MARSLSSADLAGVDIIDLAYTLGERRTKHASCGYLLASRLTMKDLQYGNFRSTHLMVPP